MEIDPATEKLYMLRQIANMDIFPATTSYKTVHRYARHGRLNLSGVTVFLQFIKTPSEGEHL